MFAAALRWPWWRWWRRLLKLGAWLLFAAWSLAVLFWLILHWGILPRLDDWRPRFETMASQALGRPLQIGRIGVQSSGWVPAFELHDVVLRDARGREALRLPRVAAALSVPSLLGLHLRFEQLLVEGARLELRRDAQGRLHVAGLDLDGEAVADGGAFADWVFEQHELVIRGAALRWVDERRAAPPLQLDEVQLVLRNRRSRHDLRLDATPPPGWGQRFSLAMRARQPLLARAGDWQRWKGTLYAELPWARVDELRRHVDLPFELDQGGGAVRAWIDWDQGQPQAATLDLALREVSLHLGAGLPPLAFAEIGGRLVAERDANGVHLQARQLAFRTAEGLDWPAGNLALSWRQRQPARAGAADAASAVPALTAPVTGGEFSADQLDLALMATLAERLPLGASLRRLLAELQPEGRVQGLAASWQGPLDAPQRYQVRAAVRGLAIAAAPASAPGAVGRPGWRGADMEISAGESGGQAKLVLADGTMEFPGVFEPAVIPLQRFGAQLVWHVTPAAAGEAGPRVQLEVRDARFANADAEGELNGRWTTGSGAGFGKGARLPGVLELDGKLSRAQATAVARYLPLGIAEDARRYVRDAVQGGQIGSASFRVKGDLWDFPFVNRRDGEFRVAAQLSGVQLAYVPSVPPGGREPAWVSPWPAFGQVDGELVFERNAMQLNKLRGRLWGLELHDVSGGIRDLGEHAALELDGQVRGPLADLLRYVNATPVGELIGGVLAPAQAGGTAELKLALNIPLDHADRTTVKGSLQLAGNELRLRTDLPLLANSRGRVDFTHKGLQLVGTSARALGGDVQLEGGSLPDGSLRFVASGVASADGLRRATELGGAARWAARLSGQTPYRLQLGFVHGHSEFTLASPLTGLAIDLPPPLRKSAEAALPLRVQAALTPESRAAGAPPRDQLRVELGGVLQALYLRDLSREPTQVLRGAIALQAPLPEPQPGVRAVAELGSVNLDQWLGALRGAAVAGAAGLPVADSDYLPQSLRLSATELVAEGRRLTRLKLALERQRAPAEAGWRAVVEADQASGSVDYREARGPVSAGRVRARLARLSLPKAEVDGVESLLDQAPTQVPALDVEVEEFELGGRKLGKLTVDAVNRGAEGGRDGGREWRLNRLALQTPDGKLSASGQWGPAAGSARRRMGLDFRLEVADAGNLLERLGFGRVVRGGKGVLAGQVGWNGSPFALDLPTLDGQMNLVLEAGQFLKVEPGVGRLLGVLSLQSLPRRLVLDFRDVFQEGFAFDHIGGDLRILRGIASTNNLRLRGVQAAVLMEGAADILRETQDLKVVVVPEINAGTASLAYAAISPAIGLGTFLGQWLLRGPLMEAGTREFRITGSWDEPKVVRVERKPGEPAPAASQAGAASAPAAASR